MCDSWRKARIAYRRCKRRAHPCEDLRYKLSKARVPPLDLPAASKTIYNWELHLWNKLRAGKNTRCRVSSSESTKPSSILFTRIRKAEDTEVLSSYFYCFQEFTVYGSCPSVQSKRFGPFGFIAACLGELNYSSLEDYCSTSGPTCSFPNADKSVND